MKFFGIVAVVLVVQLISFTSTTTISSSVEFAPEAVQTSISRLNDVSVQLASATAQTTTTLIQKLDVSVKLAVANICNAYEAGLVTLNGSFINSTGHAADEFHFFISAARSLFHYLRSLDGNITTQSLAAMETIVKNLTLSLKTFTASCSDLVKAAASTTTDVVKQFIVLLTALFGATLQIVHDSLIAISVLVKTQSGVASVAINGLRIALSDTLNGLTAVLTNENGVSSSASSFLTASVSGYATITNNVKTAVESLVANIAVSATTTLTAAASGILNTSVGFVAEAVQAAVNEIKDISVQLPTATAQTTVILIKNLDAAFDRHLIVLSKAYENCLLTLNGQFQSNIDAKRAEHEQFIKIFRSLFSLIISSNGIFTVTSVAAIEAIARKLSESLNSYILAVNEIVKSAAATKTAVAAQFIISLTALFASVIAMSHDSIVGIAALVKISGIPSEILNGLRLTLSTTLTALSSLLNSVSSVVYGYESSVKSIMVSSLSSYAALSSSVTTAVTALLGAVGNVVVSLTDGLSGLLHP